MKVGITIRVRLPWWHRLWIDFAAFMFCIGFPVDPRRVAEFVMRHARISATEARQ